MRRKPDDLFDEIDGAEAIAREARAKAQREAEAAEQVAHLTATQTIASWRPRIAEYLDALGRRWFPAVRGLFRTRIDYSIGEHFGGNETRFDLLGGRDDYSGRPKGLSVAIWIDGGRAFASIGLEQHHSSCSRCHGSDGRQGEPVLLTEESLSALMARAYREGPYEYPKPESDLD